MATMATDAAQQRRVIEHVRATVNEVDQSTQQQALLSHAAEAAESMQQQAQELIAAVSVFRLRASVAPSSAVRQAVLMPTR